MVFLWVPQSTAGSKGFKSIVSEMGWAEANSATVYEIFMWFEFKNFKIIEK